MVWVWLAIDKEVFNQDKSAANCNERHTKIGVAHFFHQLFSSSLHHWRNKVLYCLAEFWVMYHEMNCGRFAL